MATTQLIIHFERLLRINIEIPLCISLVATPRQSLKSYPCHYGRFSKLYLKTYFSTQRASLLTMSKIITWRYSLFVENLLYYKINDFFVPSTQIWQHNNIKEQSNDAKEMLPLRVLYRGALMLFFGSVSTDNFNISFTASISAVLYCFFVL